MLSAAPETTREDHGPGRHGESLSLIYWSGKTRQTCVWRYLKSAFLVTVDVPGLGRVPVNALGAAAFAILGFAQPAFWFLGLAIEAAVVPALAFNPRFQKVRPGPVSRTSRGMPNRSARNS